MRKAFLLVNRAVTSYIFPRASKNPIHCFSERLFFFPLSYSFPMFVALCLSHPCNKFIFPFPLTSVHNQSTSQGPSHIPQRLVSLGEHFQNVPHSYMSSLNPFNRFVLSFYSFHSRAARTELNFYETDNIYVIYYHYT